MLVRLELLDEFSSQKMPHLCEVLTSVHRTMSDLMWYCLISSDKDSFNALCADDAHQLLYDLELDDDAESSDKIEQLIRSPYYNVSRGMFYEAHNDEFQQHFRNHQHQGLVTPYRMAEMEFRDGELVVNLSINHGRTSPGPSRRGRDERHQITTAYPPSFTRV